MEKEDIEVTHTCQGIDEEKQRYYDTGFTAELSVFINAGEHWEVMLHLFDRMGDDEKLISITSLDVTFCPFCGDRLPHVSA